MSDKPRGRLIGTADEYGTIWHGQPGAKGSQIIGDLAYHETREETAVYLMPSEEFKRAVFLADHLFDMVDRQTWRDSGGDDGQGHYEGDYHAEQTRIEIDALKKIAAYEADE